MDQKRIAIITFGHFPEGDAGAVRLRYMARTMIDAGYSVHVLCRSKTNDFGCIDGIHYTSLRKMDGHKLIRAADYYCFPARVARFLNKSKDLHGIYLYNAPISVFQYCKRFCKKYGIRLFHDCVEWYSPEEFTRGAKDPEYRIKNKINTKILDKSFSIVAISRYLEDYFSKKGIRTLRVPILCDSTLRTNPKANKDKVVLFYAGAPLKKDMVGNVLEAALMLSAEEQAKLRIVFVGVTKKSLMEKSGIAEHIIDGCSEFLELCGRVPHDEVLRKMEEADFTVLPRDASLRYAKAGFPSKVVESLANATPILCNYSSDLELYLTDGEDALIARDHTPEALAETIRRAIALTAEDKQRMSAAALECAKKHFDYRQYVSPLKELLG